jgi:hypothetical protein
MRKRIEYAFDLDGTNFWERFFICNIPHPDDTIVYLFTEHQLKILFNWWKDTCKNKLLEKNLRAGVQRYYRTFTWGKALQTWYLPVLKNKHLFSGYKPEIKPFFWRIPLYNNTKYVNFFDGKFDGEPPDALTEETRVQTLSALTAIRPALEHKLGGPGKKDTKWLRYFGPKIFDHPSIMYCADLNTSCPYLFSS